MPPSLRGAASRPGAIQALALPPAEAPDVARDLARIDLTAGQVHVRGGDQAALVAVERHPLGEHVVGVGKSCRAVRARLVGELDAVLVQEAAGLREVGDDRLVRVDQVGVRDALQVLAERASWAGGGGVGRLAAPHADEPEVAVHRPLFLVHARLQELAGALLSAALAAGVVRGDLAGAAGLAASAASFGAPLEPRGGDLPEQRDDYDRRRGKGDGHGLTGAAGRAREEDDATRVARDLLERADHLRFPPPGRRCDRDGGPHALLELAPELLYQPLLVLLDVDVSLGDQLLA